MVWSSLFIGLFLGALVGALVMHLWQRGKAAAVSAQFELQRQQDRGQLLMQVAEKAKRLKAEGRSAVVADLVQQYDSVRVKYGASADKGPRATEIRIVVKAVRKQ